MSYYQLDKYKAKTLFKKIHKDIREILKDHNGYIAGGTITSLFSGSRINDIDVFFPEEKNVLAACVDAIRRLEVDRKPLNTEACLSFYYQGTRYQFIKMLCASPEEVIAEFDFTICQAYWIPKEDGFNLSERFMEDLAAKALVFNIYAKYPIASLVRIRKFLSRGYHISGIELIKIGLCIHKLDLKTFGQLKEQLLGVDTLILKDFLDQIEDSKDVEYEFHRFLTDLNDYLEAECEMFVDGKGDDDASSGSDNT